MDRNGNFGRDLNNKQSESERNSRVGSYALKQNYRESIAESISSDVSAVAKYHDFKDILIEAKTMQTSEKGLRIIKKYHGMKQYRQFCFLAIFILAFFERPIWCTLGHKDYCRISSDGVRIPTSNISYLNPLIFYPIQAVLLSFLTYNRYIKQTFMRSKKSKYWYIFLCAITIFIVIEGTIIMFIDTYHINISLFLKPIYFISFNRILRSTLSIYVKIVKKVIPIFILITFNILFFSILGRIVFYDQEGDNYFNNLFDTMFNFTVLQTTSNFPDVMMSYYNQHRWASLFFICFLIMNLFIMLNTVLGVFYSSYKLQMEKETKTFFLKNKNKIKSYISKYMKTKQHRKINHQNNQLLSSFMTINQGKFNAQEAPKQKSSPIVPRSKIQSICLQITKLFMTSTWGIFVGCLGLFNFLILYQMVPAISSMTNLEMWVNWNFFINLVLFLEQLLFLIGYQKQFFSNKWYYVLDFAISTAIEILLVIYWIGGFTSILPWVMFLACTRIFRFFRLLMRFESIKTLVISVYDFVPLFVNLFGVLLVMFFFFSALGQHIFGGKMTYAYNLIIDEETSSSHYILNCFNDLGTSLVLLFELLIVNNWMVNVQTHAIIMGTDNVRFFFIAWYIVAVLICMNIMVAFIIDNLVNKFSDDSEGEDQKFGEQLINQDQEYSYNKENSNLPKQKKEKALSHQSIRDFQSFGSGSQQLRNGLRFRGSSHNGEV